MTMTFGVKTTDDTDSGGGGNWIRYCNKDGEYQLRFLEEYEEWTAYWEHFSQEKRCSYPCTGNKNECPGCQSENEKEAKASKKYLVNALTRDPKSQNQGYVNLWKMAGGLKSEFLRYNDKAGGTMCDRDYVVIRTTDGNRTSYSLDREDKEPLDLTMYKESLRDHQEALNEAWLIAWDDEKRAARDKEFEDRKKAKDKKEGKREAAADEEPEPETPFILKSAKEREEFQSNLQNHPGGNDEFAEKPKSHLSVAKTEPEADENVTLTEEEIRRMDIPKLKLLYKRAGLTPNEDHDQEKLADVLIDQLTSA